MPRTKQTRQAKSIDGTDGGDLLLKDFKKHMKLRLHKMQSDYEGRLQIIETRYAFASSRFPQSVAKLTLREIIKMGTERSEENLCEVSSSVDETISPVPKTVKAKRTAQRTTTASDDGYMTEVGTTTSTTSNSLAVPTTSTKTRNIRTRSSSGNRKTKLSEIAPLKIARKDQKSANASSSAMKSKFKTPALMKHNPNEYGLVTPKVKPNTPLSVMRRPCQGEMALSMQGSPLLVTSVVNENVANVNVPLENGRVLSLLPNDGLRLSCLPEFDAETRRQLVTLRQHLDKVIGS